MLKDVPFLYCRTLGLHSFYAAIAGMEASTLVKVTAKPNESDKLGTYDQDKPGMAHPHSKTFQ